MAATSDFVNDSHLLTDVHHCLKYLCCGFNYSTKSGTAPYKTIESQHKGYSIQNPSAALIVVAVLSFSYTTTATISVSEIPS